MRLIDADALKELIHSKSDAPTDLWDTMGVLNAINTMPTVEITEEQAIDKLHETGWMQAHDKEMTSSSEPITPFIHVTVNHPDHGECDGWLDKERRVLFVEAMPIEYAKEILKWTWREDDETS